MTLVHSLIQVTNSSISCIEYTSALEHAGVIIKIIEIFLTLLKYVNKDKQICFPQETY